VSGHADDNGFIGWTFDYSIVFLPTTSISLTDPRATLVLQIDFYVHGGGAVTVDVPCIGRQDIGIIDAENHSAGNSSIVIGITPRLHADGKIVLEAEILEVNFQPFEVHTYVIAAGLLGFLGPWGRLAAFVLQVVIYYVVKHNLPIKLRAAAREAIGKQMWTLVDLSKVDVAQLFENPQYITEAVSRDPDSLLVGISSNPGMRGAAT
jgi:hypothetical protein